MQKKINNFIKKNYHEFPLSKIFINTIKNFNLTIFFINKKTIEYIFLI